MTDVSDAEIAAANEVFRERTTIYVPNDILRAALTAAAQVRERAGSVEPTEAQWNAGATALYGHSEEQAMEWGKHEKWESCGHQAAEVFKAMMGADPALMPIYDSTEDQGPDAGVRAETELRRSTEAVTDEVTGYTSVGSSGVAGFMCRDGHTQIWHKDSITNGASQMAHWRQQAEDATADAMRLHAEKMKFFEALLDIIILEGKYGLPEAQQIARKAMGLPSTDDGTKTQSLLKQNLTSEPDQGPDVLELRKGEE